LDHDGSLPIEHGVEQSGTHERNSHDDQGPAALLTMRMIDGRQMIALLIDSRIGWRTH
jgi:hypothetical protein